MKCYKCGSFLYENDYCAECGANVAQYKRIVKKSNELYNQGLEYARDRNLSGAIRCLEVSIKLYKANINARNLLGLIYVEIGEYTRGLAQWIISKSLQNDNNMADYFLEQLQNSRQDLNLMNVTIRKYNKAVGYVQQGNYDLAEIQLKKLLNDNPNMVQGHQLLALLLIRKKKLAEARVALKKAEKVDRGNPTTISYSTFIDEEMKAQEQDLTPAELKSKRMADRAAAEEHTPLSGDDVIIPKSSYREYNPTTMAIIQIIIGLLVGAAIIFFIVMPAKTRALRTEAEATQAQLKQRIEELEAEAQAAQDSQKQNNAADNKSADSAEGETKGAGGADNNQTKNQEPSTESELDIAYNNLMDAFTAMQEGNYEAAYQSMEKIQNVESFNEEFQEMYRGLRSDLVEIAAAATVNQGVEYYNAGDFSAAIEQLQSAYDSGSESEDTLYYLGRAYDWRDDYENTLKYLNAYLEKYPGGAYAVTAQQIVNSWNSALNR